MTLRVPLLWRAPNPPSPFVGRDDDVARLKALLSRDPVAVVWGFSGVGKSALVQAVLHDEHDDLQSLWLRADGRVLERLAERLTGLGHPAPPVVEALADAIEALGVWVVVDDVERLDDHEGLAPLVALLARHGRRGRLVCVCREDPRDAALRTRTLRIEPLDDAALERLTDVVAPRLPAAGRRALIAGAQGSPWRLMQLATDGGAGPAAPEASLLALSPVARGLLSTLAVAGGGLSTEVLQRATRLPDDDALRGLARRGWVERVGDAFHLHRAAAPFVATSVSVEERRRRRARLIEALLATGSPAAPGAASAEGADEVWPDALRQALSLIREAVADEGAPVAAPWARRLLVDGGEALRARGHAASLWALVVDTGLLASDELALTAPLAALAVDVGDAAVGRVATLPLDEDPRRLVEVARLRSARGDHDGARSLLRALAAAARTAKARVADERACTDAAVLGLELGDDELVRALSACLPAATARATITLLPRSEATTALATWTALPAAAREALLPALAATLLETFQVDEVLRLLPEGSEVDFSTARGRALAVVRARALSRAGDPDPWPLAARLAHDGRRSVEARWWGAVDEARRGRFPDERERSALRLALSESTSPWLQRLEASLEAPDERDRRQSPDPDLDRQLADLASDPSSATARARAMRQVARAGGDRLAALELAFVVADGHLARPDGHADALALADAIEQEATVASSARGLDEARLTRAIVAGHAGHRDGATLAALAQGGHAPMLRRRARVMLGEDVGSTLDRAVLLSVPTGPVPGARVTATAGGDREWTVDEGRRQIVVGHDVVIDLADKSVLFGLLVALGRRGGSATKEELQHDVWGERHYHPLRHDNRLKVAVRKLRRLLEEALGDDPLEAGDDGYRLRGRVRFVS